MQSAFRCFFAPGALIKRCQRMGGEDINHQMMQTALSEVNIKILWAHVISSWKCSQCRHLCICVIADSFKVTVYSPCAHYPFPPAVMILFDALPHRCWNMRQETGGYIIACSLCLQVTPSVYTQEMLQSTEERLANSKELHPTRILELLDISRTTHHKVNAS